MPADQFSCPIAVVVMAFGLRPTLAAAVASVSGQQPRAEVVVVHSGDGDPEQHLHAAGLHVPVIRSPVRLLPGAARNAGIAATSAPIVGFLADDCIARPNWLDARLKAHQSGAASVASALICHKPRNLVALAAHLSLYVRRLPGAEPDVALRYGVSYQRELFHRYGLFNETMESGEDTEFNQRLQPADRPAWSPDVQTIHNGPTTLRDFVRMQRKRGQRMAVAWNALGVHSSKAVAKDAVARTGRTVVEALRFGSPSDRPSTVLAAPLIALGNFYYALGALSGEGQP